MYEYIKIDNVLFDKYFIVTYEYNNTSEGGYRGPERGLGGGQYVHM